MHFLDRITIMWNIIAKFGVESRTLLTKTDINCTHTSSFHKMHFLDRIKIMWNIITKFGVKSRTLVIKTDFFSGGVLSMCDYVNL